MVIASGWAETNFGGHTVHWFGVAMQMIFPETGRTSRTCQPTFTFRSLALILAVASGHVAAAYKHLWFDGRDVIHRMTFSNR